ncbi:hypothetical protein PISMIDRAFT_687671 [Pisolithus microcarpus 441]|uniref:Uncharacterized protein n=1 Tax=Pisolithus microcarpus 441 TaxID=765257 RepID=A0A0C9YX95_9AGAM|nr:hypothetical protein PISMIDRAFT_687671 [Pisolithus microcarpus 441]
MAKYPDELDMDADCALPIVRSRPAQRTRESKTRRSSMLVCGNIYAHFGKTPYPMWHRRSRRLVRWHALLRVFHAACSNSRG